MSAHSALDTRQFRNVLGSFVTGVTIVTTIDGAGVPCGVTANSFSSVSLDPPLVLWSQALSSRSHRAFDGSDHFAVNILADDQIALSNHFAKSQDDKFVDVAFTAGVGGAPVLDGTAAHLECEKIATYPGGDHVVYLGRVVAMSQSHRRPLAFGGGKYMVAYSHDLGPVSLHLGNSGPRHLEALRLAAGALPRLCEDVGQHTGCIGVWGNHGPTVVHWEPSRRPVSEHLRTGLVVSTTRSAIGRAFAAFLPPEVTRAFTNEDLRLYRSAGETPERQRQRFDEDLVEVRARGLSRTKDDSSPLHQVATNAFCAPVYDKDGMMVLALALTSNATRLDPNWDGAVPLALKAAAHRLSEELGYCLSIAPAAVVA